MFNASLLCVMTVWAFSSSTAPVFFVEHPHYDHGIVEDSDPLQSDFVFSNEGRSMLQIGDIKTDCGCTAATASGTEIPPGSSGIISVVFTPRGKPGVQMTQIDVASDDPSAPVKTLSVQCTYAPKLYFSPPSVQLGPLRDDQISQETWELFLYSRDTSSLVEINSVDTSQCPGMRVELLDTESYSKKLFRFHNIAPLPAGHYHGKVLVSTTVPKVETFEISVEANVLAKLQVVPPFLALDQRDEPWKTAVRVSPGYVQDFHVMDVISDLPGFSKSITTYEDYSLLILEGSIMDCSMVGKNVEIITDVTGMEKIVLPVRVRDCE